MDQAALHPWLGWAPMQALPSRWRLGLHPDCCDQNLLCTHTITALESGPAAKPHPGAALPPALVPQLGLQLAQRTVKRTVTRAPSTSAF